MMKAAVLFFLGSLLSFQLSGQIYTGPIAKPATGYGTDGMHPVGLESFVNPYFPTEEIRIYHPSDISTPVPTLFYSHAYGGNLPSVAIGLFNFIAKKGYALVFVPYQTTGVSVMDRYENLLEGFRKAARDFPNIIDTTRVGFVGHSFGGGASFANAYTCFTENNWGANGRFIHSSAPWYLFNITQAQLTSFPSDTKLIVEIYDDDSVNDHRMAADAFFNIGIPNSEKDFIKVKSDTINSYVYSAGHDLPTTYAGFDALDYYAYYRLLDALCDYTFNGSLAGKDIALGNGSSNQISMPAGMRSLEQTDAPTVIYPESRYGFPCSSTGNPRNSYCGLALALPDRLSFAQFALYPNPANTMLHIGLEADNQLKIDIFNAQGQLLLSQTEYPSIDISALPSGTYFCKVQQGQSQSLKTFLKQ